jgi:hypothetical protein
VFAKMAPWWHVTLASEPHMARLGPEMEPLRGLGSKNAFYKFRGLVDIMGQLQGLVMHFTLLAILCH